MRMDVNGTNTSEINHEELMYTAHIFTYVLLTVILIFMLNPLCLVVLRRLSGIQETTKLFMMSLTISDLCTGIFSGIPMLTYNISQTWVLGDFLCRMFGITFTTFFTLNLFSLVLLTIDRFIAIVSPLRYPTLMTPTRAKVIIACVCSLTVTINAIFFGIIVPAQVVGENEALLCLYRCDNCLYIWICILVISLGIILILYVYILKVARHQVRCIAEQNNIGNNPDEQNAPRRISTRSATTVFIITGAVCLAWIPMIIFLLLKAKHIIKSKDILDVGELLFYSNSWLNVVIYYFRNREFRQALHNLVSSRHH